MYTVLYCKSSGATRNKRRDWYCTSIAGLLTISSRTVCEYHEVHHVVLTVTRYMCVPVDACTTVRINYIICPECLLRGRYSKFLRYSYTPILWLCSPFRRSKSPPTVRVHDDHLVIGKQHSSQVQACYAPFPQVQARSAGIEYAPKLEEGWAFRDREYSSVVLLFIFLGIQPYYLLIKNKKTLTQSITVYVRAKKPNLEYPWNSRYTQGSRDVSLLTLGLCIRSKLIVGSSSKHEHVRCALLATSRDRHGYFAC
jgi:hypothetical protein